MMSLKKVVNSVLQHSPPLVSTVREWCKKQSLPIHILREPEFEEWELPASPTPESINSFERSRQYYTYQLYRVDLEGCEVRGLDGLIVLPDGTFSLEPVWWNERHIRMSADYKKRIQPAKTPLKGPLVSLLQQFCKSYFHWIHDSLGKLWLTQEAFPPNVRYLVPEGLSDNQLNLLKAFGISREQCIKVGVHDRIAPETLIYVSSVVSCGRYSREQTRWLADSLKRHFGLEGVIGKKRILISRAKAAFRRIRNEDDVSQWLSDYGFESYQLECMSIQEQAELFARAEIVLGPHGAGFTNLYFAQPNTRVAELFPFGDIRPFYWGLSQALALKYVYDICDTKPASYNQNDLIVDETSTKAFVEEIIAGMCV
jgi:capsular polysaccharide biosynthesis protein